MRGAMTQALYRHLAKHTESPMRAAAHLQLEAVRRAAAQMIHRNPTCSFGSGTSHSGFTRSNPVELGRGAVEPLNRG